ncbi:Npun_F5749 family FMN-dependent PPOX-type flavoprotein [Roseofilum casamattae]|uniref:Pyridoxamine 5'-phosphate oxidase family protein n=1 Tax=Roseofilum casamattae BLCC-M143 TaxID=3022442 RepID=A0ABT7C0F5_9CYAN|nr:Npun_F5749 family FMN-dependent PPOX-type flavoprotein [Roseofilum casamattae]MDJ1184929.1 pyridoxamine 5'-phosphate oxidase family protein [Roseofilum casamattae BLCC-M143]
MDNLPSWRSQLSLALENNKTRPESSYFQLATIRPDGRPANRSLVFRGFVPNSDRLKIATDGRSAKIADLRHCPNVEVCWYFSLTREQFRISGSIAIVTEDNSNPAWQQERIQLWQNLSAASRQQFARPECGALRSPDWEFDRDAPDPDYPLPHFYLLLLEPKEVERLDLQLNPPPRDRYLWQPGGSWTHQSVNP